MLKLNDKIRDIQGGTPNSIVKIETAKAANATENHWREDSFSLKKINPQITVTSGIIK